MPAASTRTDLLIGILVTVVALVAVGVLHFLPAASLVSGLVYGRF